MRKPTCRLFARRGKDGEGQGVLRVATCLERVGPRARGRRAAPATDAVGRRLRLEPDDEWRTVACIAGKAVLANIFDHADDRQPRYAEPDLLAGSLDALADGVGSGPVGLGRRSAARRASPGPGALRAPNAAVLVDARNLDGAPQGHGPVGVARQTARRPMGGERSRRFPRFWCRGKGWKETPPAIFLDSVRQSIGHSTPISQRADPSIFMDDGPRSPCNRAAGASATSSTSFVVSSEACEMSTSMPSQFISRTTSRPKSVSPPTSGVEICGRGP